MGCRNSFSLQEAGLQPLKKLLSGVFEQPLELHAMLPLEKRF